MLSLLIAAVVQVTEPHSGIEFTVPAELPCVYIPQGSLNDGCGRADPEKLKGMLLQQTFVFAVNPETGVFLMGRRVPAKSSATMSEGELDDYVRGVASGMKNLGAYAPEANGEHLHAVQTYDGLRVATYGLSADNETKKRVPNQAFVAGALIPTKTEIVSLMTTSPARDGSVGKMLTTMKVPSALQGNSLFGTSEAHHLGYATGQVLGGLVCFGVAIASLVSLLRRRKS